MEDKRIEELKQHDLIKIILDLADNQERRLINLPTNKVTFCDVTVESNTETLQSCKNTVDDLIKKHHKFATLRKNKVIAQSQGYFG